MSLDEFIDVPKQAELYSITAEEKKKPNPDHKKLYLPCIVQVIQTIPECRFLLVSQMVNRVEMWLNI